MKLEELLSSFAESLSGERAKDVAVGIARFHRIQASPGYDEAVEYVTGLLKESGIKHQVHEYPADGTARTYEWTAPPAWTIRSGCLRQVKPEEKSLCSFDEIPQAVIAHSPGGRVEGDLVHVGNGDSDVDYEGRDVKGKIILACGRASQVNRQATKRGAIGVVIYPDSERASASHDFTLYQGIFPKAEEIPNLVPSFSISRRAADGLVKILDKEAVRLRGKIDAEFIDNSLRVIEAWIPGIEAGTDEVLLTAHLCHPRQSANDNASGSALLVEIARTIRELREKIPLRDTVRFLWVPEFYGTIPWAAEHEEELKRVHYALNLDMVGQSPEAIGEPLHVFGVPNAVPNYLNALIEPIAARVAAMPGAVSAGGSKRPLHFLLDVPSGGSDHLVFGAPPHRLPAVMFNHDDPYWHTDFDSMDHVDSTRLKQVGMIAATLAVLPWGDEDEHVRLCEWVLSYSVRALTRASGLAGEVGPERGRRLLDVALQVEEERARSLTRRIPEAALLAHLERHEAVLREVHGHLVGFLSRIGAQRNGENKKTHPTRVIDGPLVYAVTESLDEQEKDFFKEKMSLNHRAMAEGLLNLCDGQRSSEEIAVHLSLDFQRIVAIEDVDKGIELLEKAGYVQW
jgi:aminopeptidase-like protein